MSEPPQPDRKPGKGVKPSPIGLAIMASGLFCFGIGLVILGFVKLGFWLFCVPVGALMIYGGFKTALKA
jgi:hypothetical protein